MTTVLVALGSALVSGIVIYAVGIAVNARITKIDQGITVAAALVIALAVFISRIAAA
jgi:hypothetical protein